MKIRQVRDMTTEDINHTLQESYEALENLTFQHATGQLENFMSVPNLKRDISRMKTVLRERELKINDKLNTKL